MLQSIYMPQIGTAKLEALGEDLVCCVAYGTKQAWPKVQLLCNIKLP